MNIQIIGSNCSNGIKLRKNLERTLNDNNLNASFICLDDERNMKKHNTKNAPMLIINGIVVSEGKVLNNKELLRIMKNVCLC